MGFDKKTREDALVSSARCCCVCREFKGVKVEVHHIIPKEQGGTDDFENAIPLCFDCHADAGHYHAKHPKGTKYSPDELRKQRDAWYRIVREGKSVSSQLSTENLICQYAITSDRDVVADIINNDIKIAYFNETLYYQPKGFDTIIDYFFYDKEYKISQIDSFESKEEYLLKNTNAQKIADKVSYDLYNRPFTENELIMYNDYKFQVLRQNDYSIDQIIQRRCYYQGCGELLVEEIRTTSLYMCFLSIYNITDDFIQLDELEILTYKKEVEVIKFPNVMIQPKATVLMPIAVMIKPLDTILNTLYAETSYVKDYEVQEFSRVKAIKNDMLPIPPSFNPCSIKYYHNSKAYCNEIHNLDLNNLYRISRTLEIGSCPHVFYLDTKDHLRYWGEIFNKNYGVNTTEKIVIPKNAKKIIIVELEHETTYIESIDIDNDKVSGSLKLIKGDVIEINNINNEILTVKGYYLSAINPSTTQSRLEKNEILKSFEYNYMKNNVIYNIKKISGKDKK